VYGYSLDYVGVGGNSGWTGVQGTGTTYGVYGSGQYGVYGTGTTYDFYGTKNSAFAQSVTSAAFLYSSDASLKKNIATLDNSLEKILKLRGVSFNWKKDNQASIGLIAQEVEDVYPELVTGEDGSKAVQYGNLVAVLIEAVKEQQKEIDELEARIEVLEAG
ncbi:MAG: tail fiber domain-containing protein, partial [Candidatus Aenigmarchaeota archaeon]|nr:tail fiber domain-containing protein [Candidatus Aenigmarchaeota archaeon]